MAIPVLRNYCVYLGPTVRGGFPSGTVLMGKREDVIKKYAFIFDQHPRMKPLVIPSDQAAQVLHEIKTPGTAFHRLYEKAAKSGKEGE